MSMLSKLFKGGKVKDKVNDAVKAFIDSKRPELFGIMKSYLAPDIAVTATDAIVSFLKTEVDRVW
jgi:hypothetical protein